MREFALSDAARGKLNSELAHHESHQRIAVATAFVVAPLGAIHEVPILIERTIRKHSPRRTILGDWRYSLAPLAQPRKF